MKKILIILAAALTVIGCQRKIDLKAESERLFDNLDAAYDPEMSSDELGYLFEQTMDSVFMLLRANMGAPYSDSLFLDIYPYFSVEQQDELMAIMAQKMKESPEMARVYQSLQAKNATAEGKPYIDFTALTPEGDELSLSQLVGNTDYVLVDFWASWCGPCRRLIPALKEMYALNKGAKRLQILSCSVDQDEAAWRKALNEEHMPWPQVHEDEAHKCSEWYGVQFIPHTVLIDREGKIAGVNLEEADIEAIVFGE